MQQHLRCMFCFGSSALCRFGGRSFLFAVCFGLVTVCAVLMPCHFRIRSLDLQSVLVYDPFTLKPLNTHTHSCTSHTKYDSLQKNIKTNLPRSAEKTEENLQMECDGEHAKWYGRGSLTRSFVEGLDVLRCFANAKAETTILGTGPLSTMFMSHETAHPRPSQKQSSWIVPGTLEESMMPQTGRMPEGWKISFNWTKSQQSGLVRQELPTVGWAGELRLHFVPFFRLEKSDLNKVRFCFSNPRVLGGKWSDQVMRKIADAMQCLTVLRLWKQCLTAKKVHTEQMVMQARWTAAVNKLFKFLKFDVQVLRKKSKRLWSTLSH